MTSGQHIVRPNTGEAVRLKKLIRSEVYSLITVEKSHSTTEISRLFMPRAVTTSAKHGPNMVQKWFSSALRWIYPAVLSAWTYIRKALVHVHR